MRHNTVALYCYCYTVTRLHGYTTSVGGVGLRLPCHSLRVRGFFVTGPCARTLTCQNGVSRRQGPPSHLSPPQTCCCLLLRSQRPLRWHCLRHLPPTTSNCPTTTWCWTFSPPPSLTASSALDGSRSTSLPWLCPSAVLRSCTASSRSSTRCQWRSPGSRSVTCSRTPTACSPSSFSPARPCRRHRKSLRPSPPTAPPSWPRSWRGTWLHSTPPPVLPPCGPCTPCTPPPNVRPHPPTRPIPENGPAVIVCKILCLEINPRSLCPWFCPGMEPSYVQQTLGNGLRVVIVPRRSAGLVYVSLVMRNGRIDETRETWSYTHMGEHLLAKYTSKPFPTFEGVKGRLGLLGVENNAYTDTYDTGYWLVGPSDHLPFLLRLLSGVYFDYQFTDHWQRQRNIVMEELKSRASNLWTPLEEQVNRVLYPRHRLGVTWREELHTIGQATQRDVVRHLQSRLD
ncbi:MAG: hypothetical protein EBY17_27190, partial [Acidobacteriia bacterium]|nr:hypothetical protein [Terriglobia bacterium]